MSTRTYPSQIVSHKTGEHPADFQPGNSKGATKQFLLPEKSIVKFFQIFQKKKSSKGPNFLYRWSTFWPFLKGAECWPSGRIFGTCRQEIQGKSQQNLQRAAPCLPQSIQSARLSLQSSRIGSPPPPHPQESVAPSPPLVPRGGTTLACGRRGGGSQFGRRDRHSGTQYNIIPLRILPCSI